MILLLVVESVESACFIGDFGVKPYKQRLRGVEDQFAVGTCLQYRIHMIIDQCASATGHS